MNPRLPVTHMLPINAKPTRTMVVSDPEKLTYFARANAVRAGVANTWGAFSGFGDAMPDHAAADSNDVKAAGSAQSVGDFFGNLGRSLLGAITAPGSGGTPPPPVTVREEPSALPYVLVGVGALALGGFVVYKLVK